MRSMQVPRNHTCQLSNAQLAWPLRSFAGILCAQVGVGRILFCMRRHSSMWGDLDRH